MKTSTANLHRIGVGLYLMIYLPFAADVVFDLGWFGRAGKGIALAMMGIAILYLIRYAPARQDKETRDARDQSSAPSGEND